jgi:hypothetical protein
MAENIGYEIKKVDNRRYKEYACVIEFRISVSPGEEIRGRYEEVGSFAERMVAAVNSVGGIGEPKVTARPGYGRDGHSDVYYVKLWYEAPRPKEIMGQWIAEKIVENVTPVLVVWRDKYVADWKKAHHQAEVERQADHIAAHVVGHVRKQAKEEIKFDTRLNTLVDELRRATMAATEAEIEDMEKNGVQYESGEEASDEVVTAAIRKAREKAADENIARGGRFPR